MTLQQRAILLDMSTARQLIVDDKAWVARRILVNATSHVMYRPETGARIGDAIHALDRGDLVRTMQTIDFVLANGADS